MKNTDEAFVFCSKAGICFNSYKARKQSFRRKEIIFFLFFFFSIRDILLHGEVQNWLRLSAESMKLMERFYKLNHLLFRNEVARELWISVFVFLPRWSGYSPQSA